MLQASQKGHFPYLNLSPLKAKTSEEFSKPPFKKIYLFYCVSMNVGFLHARALLVCLVPSRSEKSQISSSEQELQTIMSLHVEAGNLTQVLLQEQSYWAIYSALE